MLSVLDKKTVQVKCVFITKLIGIEALNLKCLHYTIQNSDQLKDVTNPYFGLVNLFFCQIVIY